MREVDVSITHVPVPSCRSQCVVGVEVMRILFQHDAMVSPTVRWGGVLRHAVVDSRTLSRIVFSPHQNLRCLPLCQRFLN